MERVLLRFDDFELDVGQQALRRSGRDIPLEPKPFALLHYLIEHRDRVVPKDELLETLWPDVIVGDASLSSAIREVRVALGDDAKRPRFVQTFWRRGYRFIGTSEATSARVAPPGHPVQREADRRVADPVQRAGDHREPHDRAPVAAGPWAWAASTAAALLMALWFIDPPTLAQPGPEFDRLPRSVAVVSFENFSSDPAELEFSAAVSERLRGALEEFGRFQVVPQSAMAPHARPTRPAHELLRALQVDALVAGTLRREAHTIRVSARILRVGHEENLWLDVPLAEAQPAGLGGGGGSAAGGLPNALFVARHVASSITQAIAPELSVPDLTRTLFPDAFDAFVRGRDLATWQRSSTHRAIHELRRAVALHPGMSAAHPWLADLYRRSSLEGERPAAHAMPKARWHALEAIRLGQDAAGRAQLAWIAMLYDWDFERALTGFRGAEATAQSWPPAAQERSAVQTWTHLGNGALHCARGSLQRCTQSLRDAVWADPWFPRQTVGLRGVRSAIPFYGEALARMRKYDEAVEVAEWMNFPAVDRREAHRVLWLAHWWQGRHAEAVEAYAELEAFAGRDPGAAALAYERGGFGAFMEEVLDAALRRREHAYTSPTEIASYYAYLGDASRAFAWLDTAYRERDSALIFAINMNPSFDPIRSDGRFARLADRLGLPVSTVHRRD